MKTLNDLVGFEIWVKANGKDYEGKLVEIRLGFADSYALILPIESVHSVDEAVEVPISIIDDYGIAS